MPLPDQSAHRVGGRGRRAHDPPSRAVPSRGCLRWAGRGGRDLRRRGGGANPSGPQLVARRDPRSGAPRDPRQRRPSPGVSTATLSPALARCCGRGTGGRAGARVSLFPGPLAEAGRPPRSSGNDAIFVVSRGQVSPSPGEYEEHDRDGPARARRPSAVRILKRRPRPGHRRVRPDDPRA